MPIASLPVRQRLFSHLLQVEAMKQGLGLSLLPCFLGNGEPGLLRVPGTAPLPGKSI